VSGQNLVIVESPAKAKTIERYLGPGYTVLASYGHVRDLPRSNFAIEVDGSGGGCSLTYEIPERSAKHVAALRKAAKTADTVWLAPDLDREGEAIAWHLAEVLGLDVATTNRVTFDEITEPAIRAAFADPRHLDMALVEAQQARRAVDRIVGYRLSPVLWRTVASGISAGRVQSVALRLIVDREDEIRAFVPETYFDLAGLFGRAVGEQDIRARMVRVDGLRLATPKDLEGKDERARAELRVVRTQEEADALVVRAERLTYTVSEVRRTQQQRNPKPPFKTSTLQGEGSRIGFSARQTMAVAQQLYEGIALGGGEQVGLITYMRTDSLNLSDQALNEIGGFVRSEYGDRYALDKPRRATNATKGAQEAHEAVRPTSVLRTPDSIRRYLTGEQARLYELIWSRTVATQMAPAVFDRVAADVTGADADGDVMFRVTGQVERFDGFLRAYRMERDEDDAVEEDGDGLPDLDEGEMLHLAAVVADSHETSPPPRYSERTLVEALEEHGIGRPSTYASIISTLEQRAYVTKDSRRFFPTPLGEVVVAFLLRHFPEIVDLAFTARMEETLDEIATGDARWCGTVTGFLDEVDTWVSERKPERPRLPLRNPTPCPDCGAPMERVFSGKARDWFASCNRWPDCDGTLPLEPDGTVGERLDVEPDENVPCPICAKPMQLRDGRYGRFFSCVEYPSCKGVRNLQQRAVHMTADGAIAPFRSVTDPRFYMELRTSRYGKPFVGTTGYPEDVFSVWSLPLATPCPECGAPLRQPPRNRKVPTAICANPTVNHVFELATFDVPTVATQTVVDGIPAYDPELGGDPLAMEDVPGPIAMTYVGSQDPPAPRVAKKATKRTAAGGDASDAAAAKKAAKKATTKKATKKKATRKVTKKRTTRKAVAKKAVAKKAAKRPGRSSVGRPVESTPGS
jgi:DNA topoisomerase-1